MCLYNKYISRAIHTGNATGKKLRDDDESEVLIAAKSGRVSDTW